MAQGDRWGDGEVRELGRPKRLMHRGAFIAMALFLPPVLPHECWDYRCMLPQLDFYMGSMDPNTGFQGVWDGDGDSKVAMKSEPICPLVLATGPEVYVVRGRTRTKNLASHVLTHTHCSPNSRN